MHTGAFYLTLHALNRFQNINTVGGNPYCLPALNLWFLSTEFYISTIYKIAQEHAKANPPQAINRTDKVVEKFVEINKYFSNGAAAIPKLRTRLQEFSTFRNTLLHDLTMVKTPQYHHTFFASNAEKLNEVDLFQAILISIETFSYFRYVFKRLDLMPNIPINNQFDKGDILVKEILFPAFTEILSQKGLTTNLDLQMPLEAFEYEYEVPLKPVISHQGPSCPRECEATSDIARHFFSKAVDARPINDDVFKLPNYVRQ